MTRRPATRPALELGAPVEFGTGAVEKRLKAMSSLRPFGGERLLDVGCGTGAYTLRMAERYSVVLAIDVEPERLNSLRRKLTSQPHGERLRLAQMSAERLAFADGYFDTVTAIEVLEHITDLSTAVREIARVLKPGGTFFATCPNRLFPLETHAVRNRRGELVDGRLFPLLPYIEFVRRRIATARNFSREELRRLMAAAGLRESSVTYVMPPFDHWEAGRRWIKPLSEWLETTPLKVFGVSIVGAYTKSPSPPASGEDPAATLQRF